MGKRGRNNFSTSLAKNMLSNNMYLRRLCELSMSMFKWEGLPDSVDVRYMEMELFLSGQALFFKDEVMGYLTLGCLANGSFDVYGEPVSRRAYSRYSGYNSDVFSDKDSVIIWNNYLHINSVLDVEMFARRLYNIDRIIDVNANAQKTPVLVQGTEKQRLSLLNMYKEYDGNSPVIFGDKNLDLNSLKVLKTDAPYVCDKLTELKTQIWNEALTYLGISNINIQKKERLITDEVTRNQGGTIASRYSRLESRREAVNKINNMFGTNIEVNYREDFQQIDTDIISDVGRDTTGEGV